MMQLCFVWLLFLKVRSVCCVALGLILAMCWISGPLKMSVFFGVYFSGVLPLASCLLFSATMELVTFEN
jgi:hypothetical protein